MKVAFTIRVEDCGGYYQVYKTETCRYRSKSSKKWEDGEVDNKLGNIYPPGFSLFGEIFSDDQWVATKGGADRSASSSLETALCYLITNRS